LGGSTIRGRGTGILWATVQAGEASLQSKARSWRGNPNARRVRILELLMEKLPGLSGDWKGPKGRGKWEGSTSSRFNVVLLNASTGQGNRKGAPGKSPRTIVSERKDGGRGASIP